MVRYGLKQDIKIDLTLLDDMNDFKNIIEGVLIKERFLYQTPSDGEMLTDRDTGPTWNFPSRRKLSHARESFKIAPSYISVTSLASKDTT